MLRALRAGLAITFALAFSVVAEHFGLATILGAFLAGFLIPVFFVSTGVGLDFLHVPRPSDRTHPSPPARRHCPTAASTRPAETAWSSRW